MRPRVVVRSLLVVALVPFAVLGVLVLTAWLYGQVRYDPAYFTESYLERYRAVDATVRGLEGALQVGDQALLAELQGLRRPGHFPVSEDIRFVMLWGRTGRYSTYLFFDRQTYERFLIPFEFVRGRWVVAPQDLCYAMGSGRWRAVFFPAAVAWWVVGLAGLGLVWACCGSARFRAWLCG